MRLAIFICALFVLQVVSSERACEDNKGTGDHAGVGPNRHHHRHRTHRHRTHLANGTVLASSSSESEEIYSTEDSDEEPAGGEGRCEDGEMKTGRAHRRRGRRHHSVSEDGCEDSKPVNECEKKHLSEVPEDKCEDDVAATSTVPDEGCDDDVTTTPVDKCAESSDGLDANGNQCPTTPSSAPTTLATTQPTEAPTELPTSTSIPTEAPTNATVAETVPPTTVTTVTESPTTLSTIPPTTEQATSPTTVPPPTTVQATPESGALAGARGAPTVLPVTSPTELPTTLPATTTTTPQPTTLPPTTPQPTTPQPTTLPPTTPQPTTLPPTTPSTPQPTTLPPTTPSTPQPTTMTPTTAAAIMTTMRVTTETTPTNPPTTPTTTPVPLPRLSRGDCGRLKLSESQYEPIMQKLTETVGTLSDPTILNYQIQFLINRAEKITSNSRCEFSVTDLLQDIWNVVCQSWPLLQDILQQAADADSDLSQVAPIIEQLRELTDLQRKVLEPLQPYAEESGNTAQYNAVKYLLDRLADTLAKLKEPLEQEDRSQIQSLAKFAQEVVNAIDTKSGR